MKICRNDQLSKFFYKTLGSYREAYFYKYLSPRLSGTTRCPKTYMAMGDPETGRSVVLIEKVPGAQHIFD